MMPTQFLISLHTIKIRKNIKNQKIKYFNFQKIYKIK